MSCRQPTELGSRWKLNSFSITDNFFGAGGRLDEGESPATNKKAASARNECRSRQEKWWSQTGSNRRHRACKARALPAELWPQTCDDSQPAHLLQRGSLRFPARRTKTRGCESRLVGLGRFELPTSRLSSARSNQLSYRP
jgi:hypothetical protein